MPDQLNPIDVFTAVNRIMNDITSAITEALMAQNRNTVEAVLHELRQMEERINQMKKGTK